MTTDDRADLLRDLWRHRATLPPGQAQRRITRCIDALSRCWLRVDRGNAPASTACHREAVEVLDRMPPELMERVQRAARVTA